MKVKRRTPKEEGGVLANRWVGLFMTACQPVEKHLIEGHPLTVIEEDSVTNTIKGLQTALEVWIRKNQRLHRSAASFED
jgi:hypothetical protein